MKKQSTKGTIKFSAILYVLAVIGISFLMNACNKGKNIPHITDANAELRKAAGKPLVQHEPITSVVTIANMRTTTDGSITRVMFNQNEEIFSVTDATTIATLKSAFSNHQAVQISFDPWLGIVSQASIASTQDQAYFSAKPIANTAGTTLRIDPTTSDDEIDHAAQMGVINTTTTGLTNVIPDMTTAQLMFDFIAHQCCQLPGPYSVTFCITFQYCPDGCYARASKMCEILNNNYHYGTQKVFSFANAGHDELCVKAEKWGGCCINWWYHVAPLVTIKTATGPKAFVFDPAMFDQPVLLSTWLHAQANPACVPGGDVPHVSMINIQPNSSYSPSTGSGYSFDTDPGDINADATLVSYRYLTSCP